MQYLEWDEIMAPVPAHGRHRNGELARFRMRLQIGQTPAEVDDLEMEILGDLEYDLTNRIT